MDPQPWGPDWMPITLRTPQWGVLFACRNSTSLRQIELNRRNAQRSAGPKTQSGKARSSQNAVRHGLTAETVIGRLEDPADYLAFEQAVTTAYDAETAVKRELVLRLASLLWRLRPARSRHSTKQPPHPIRRPRRYPEKCARLSKYSSPGATRVEASLRAAFFVWPTSITEFSNGSAAMSPRSGARSGKRFSRCNTCNGGRRVVVIGEPWIVGEGNVRDQPP